MTWLNMKNEKIKKKEKLQWIIEEKRKKRINKKKKENCVNLCQFLMWYDMTWHDMKKIGENIKKKGKWKKIQWQKKGEKE